jgi:hypothetical protein
MPLLNKNALPRYQTARALHYHHKAQAVVWGVMATGDIDRSRPAGAHCRRQFVAGRGEDRIVAAFIVPYTRVRRGKDERWQGYNRECALSACDG